jgi:hypothetical protein
VAFEAKELWGADHHERAPVYLDCWEDYLERDRAGAKPAAEAATKPAIKSAARQRAAKPVARTRAHARKGPKKR